MKSAKITSRLIVLSLLFGLLLASPAHALRVNFQAQGDSDKITFSFDSGKLPEFKVRRTGTETMMVTFPPSTWNNEPKPGTKDYPGKLIKGIRAADNGVILDTKTKAFGFISVPVPGKAQFVLQVYRDPIGARWKPRKPKPAAVQVAQPKIEPVQPQPQPQVQPQATSSPAAQSTQQPQPAQPQATQSVAPAGEADLPPDNGRKPFFSVPYSVRTSVTPPGEGQPVSQASAQQGQAQTVQGQPQAQGVTAPSAEAETGIYPPASELRFKAVNKMAEEVKFAELAGDTAGRAPVIAQVSEPDQQAVSGSVGGVVQGVSQPVEAAGQGAAGGQVAPPPGAASGEVAGQVEAPAASGGAVTPPPTQVSGEGQAGGGVAPPPGVQPVQSQPVQAQPIQAQPVQVQPVQQADGGVAGSVAPPPGAAGGAVAPPPGTAVGVVSAPANATGGTVALPPTVVEGAAPPEMSPEEAGQLAAQEVVPPPVVEEPPVEESVVEEPTSEDVSQTDDAAEGEGEEPVDPNAPLTKEQRIEKMKEDLAQAQSMMFNGALASALPIYEDILKQLDVPQDIREETLYAVADIKKEMHKDELEDYFSELSQAYIEAMNTNLQSNRVPSALLNLGLLNLRVGNFPEAKAYFKILQDKYPDDDNIPSISYYWGEYYYKKGDYKKAADQFQYLIQTYPEHELVKNAAFYLADSLERTGFIEQAYQIIDYIDKRWPDYYMENTAFLPLAGNVEMALKKWPQAKNHFFTYYNLNPEAEGSDVVLAHLGDIYIREGERKAAAQIYQKVVEDYPDKEGGLIAKMRIAEEGIYDEPSMAEMVSIFDRPYNKRPEDIYREIVENHPDSPLAPIAQLKLAMWYAFNKKYPESLTAAQDFIEKYPNSPLIDRARTLGDSVFTLAVPGMVGEERYGRLVRYWETYDFIGQKDTKVDDRTRLNVALSYWKVGQPGEALKIITPYLQKRQIPEISEEALGMAVNIYLDQLAWQEIADLISMAKSNWKLKPAQLRQLDYARAVSFQNLGEANRALPMWAELAKEPKVEPAFRAYAMYYMAKAAMERQDLRKVFVYAQEALALLLQTRGDQEKIKDAVLMSIYATERSGRYNEALKWAKEYDQYIDVDNPEWASTRFKLARIYRKAGALEEWKQLLTDIIEKKPETLQAQLARSALETYELEQQAQKYAPGFR